MLAVTLSPRMLRNLGNDGEMKEGRKEGLTKELTNTRDQEPMQRIFWYWYCGRASCLFLGCDFSSRYHGCARSSRIDSVASRSVWFCCCAERDYFQNWFRSTSLLIGWCFMMMWSVVLCVVVYAPTIQRSRSVHSPAPGSSPPRSSSTSYTAAYSLSIPYTASPYLPSLISSLSLPCPMAYHHPSPFPIVSSRSRLAYTPQRGRTRFFLRFQPPMRRFLVDG